LPNYTKSRAAGFSRAFLSMVFLVSITSGCHQSNIMSDAGAQADSAARSDSTTPPPVPAWAECNESDECVAVPESCCGQCGVATPDDMIGVNREFQSAYRVDVACAGGGEDCPLCAAIQDPNLVAVCSQNRCEARDLRDTEVSTGCVEDNDCILASPTCCEGCGILGEDSLIAIERGAQAQLFEELGCSETLACDDCIGEPDPSLRAVCIVDADSPNRCMITRSSTSAPTPSPSE